MASCLNYLLVFLQTLAAAEHSILVHQTTEEPWHQKVRMFHFPELFAQDLKASNGSLAEDLSSSPDTMFIIDFYAPWCPHCNHFAPDMERLALAIQKSQTEGKGKLKAAVVDCVAHKEVCRTFNVGSIPHLMYGQGKAFIEQNLSKIQTVEVANRSAETVAKWIEDQSKQEFHINFSEVSKQAITQQLLAKEGANNVDKKPGNAATAGGNLWDAKLAAALLLRTVFETQTFKDVKQQEMDDTKVTLFKTLDLLTDHFPDSSGKCRSSFSKLSKQLNSEWETRLIRHSYTTWDHQHKTDIIVDPDQVEKDWQICDADWNEFGTGWGACRGSWPQKRGYTCGLWTLMHFLAANSSDATAANSTDTLRSMIQQFFNCRDCREHFAQIPYDRNQIKTKQDMQLWWWHAHNQVNERVMKVEADEGDGDPVYPKSLWPTKELCSDCHPGSALSAGPSLLRVEGTLQRHLPAQNFRDDIAARGWDILSVEKFLGGFYTLGAEHTVSLPVGAKSAIKLAKTQTEAAQAAEPLHPAPGDHLRWRPVQYPISFSG